MKRILLVDVDSKIPNLALMKLSTYYKLKGYKIILEKLGFDGIPHKRDKKKVFIEDYKKVFISIIFTQNKNVVELSGDNNEVYFGGTGYDLNIKLDKEIDDCVEDYSIYPDNNISYGFITRGCIRNCSFCFVPKKEGMIHKYREVDEIVRHKKVKFLDNNILAYNKHEEILQELIDKNIKCQFNQGLDIRLLTDKNAELLSRLNHIGEYFFAYDDISDKEIIGEKFKLWKKYVNKDWKTRFFIYCNSNMKINNVVERVEWCKNNKALVFFMRDKNCWESKDTSFYSDLASFCQSIRFFKCWNFNKFMDARTKNEIRQIKHKRLYESACSS